MASIDQIVNELAEIAGTSIVVSRNDIADQRPAVPQAGSRQPLNTANRFAPLSNINRAIRLAIQAIQQLRVVGGLDMNVCGPYSSLMLPAVNLGSALTSGPGCLTTFFGRRGCKGTSGTTTVELEKNGVATGKILTWESTDPDFTLKSIDVNITAEVGDRFSLRILTAEAGAQDLFCVVAP